MFQPGHPSERMLPFRFAAYTRVAFSDTDAQGVVYYGRYLPYFDLARTEYHRSLGDIGAARHEFVMRASDVEYHAPARFDDLLEVFVRVSRIGRTSATYEYAAYKIEDNPDREGGVLMVTATQTLVLIDHDNRSTLAIPDTFRAHVSAFERVEL
jgi:acyl-CoA thioester hydrolase